MKSYPSINHIKGIEPEQLDSRIYVFDKLDGSNIRAEWNPKRGFYKFGSRKTLIDESHPLLGRSIPLIREKYESHLDKIFRSKRWKKAVAFFEFYGPQSFAGYHEKEDDHTVTLFDVTINNQGFLTPREFVNIFQRVETPTLLHQGAITSDLIDQIKTGTLDKMTFEGVVCKGEPTSPGLPLMFKIKNKAWIDKVHARWAGDENEIKKRL